MIRVSLCFLFVLLSATVNAQRYEHLVSHAGVLKIVNGVLETSVKVVPFMVPDNTTVLHIGVNTARHGKADPVDIVGQLNGGAPGNVAEGGGDFKTYGSQAVSVYLMNSKTEAINFASNMRFKYIASASRDNVLNASISFRRKFNKRTPMYIGIVSKDQLSAVYYSVEAVAEVEGGIIQTAPSSTGVDVAEQ